MGRNCQPLQDEAKRLKGYYSSNASIISANGAGCCHKADIKAIEVSLGVADGPRSAVSRCYDSDDKVKVIFRHKMKCCQLIEGESMMSFLPNLRV
jgi:hypothetical protein